MLAYHRSIDVSVYVFWCEEVGWEVKKNLYPFSNIQYYYLYIWSAPLGCWSLSASSYCGSNILFVTVGIDRNFGRLSPAWGFAKQAINGVRFERAGKWNEKGRAREFCKPGNADLSFMFVFAEWFVFRFLACDLSIFFPSIPTTSLIKTGY